MAVYLHGVYTQEVATSVQPTSTGPSCLPMVWGTSAGTKVVTEPVLCTSWDDFKSKFGVETPESTNTLDWFAKYWFTLAGGGACVLVKLGGETINDSTVVASLDYVSTVFEALGVIPNVFYVPSYFGEGVDRLATLAEKFAGDFKAIAVADIPTKSQAPLNFSDISAGTVEEAEALASGTTLPSRASLALCWPEVDTSSGVFPLGTVMIGVMTRTDANVGGGYPYVSPSNQPAPAATGLSANGSPVWMNAEKVNDALERFGIVSMVRNARGWVIWGDRTSVYPENTDPKDSFISCRRMFNYVNNDFLQFAIARVDLPLNRRQLDGITYGYTTRLNALVAQGAIVAGRAEIIAAENPAESLLDGMFKTHLYVAVPPPMRAITGVIEYDVEAFVSSLTE